MAGEDEQYDVYKRLVQGMAPRPVTIRTFDIDERQLARPLVDAALDARWFPEHERAGHAGMRGIRFGLAQPADLQDAASCADAGGGPRVDADSLPVRVVGAARYETRAR
jgi:phosphoenolpyruvate-protein kinase (PTS system EI component)